MLVYINEILDEMKSGMTNPRLCKGEDSKLYVVKGIDATGPGLVREYIAAQLGQSLGIQIPAFSLVYIDQLLLDYHPDRARLFTTLGPGVCFGSEYIDTPSVVRSNEIDMFDSRDRCRLLLFDWLISNLDRSDINTNLLRSSDGSMCVIDHNLAFDKDFNDSDFFKRHLFRRFRQMPVGLGFLKDFSSRAKRTLPQLASWWNNLPQEWLVNEYGDVRDLKMNYDCICSLLEEKADTMEEVFSA